MMNPITETAQSPDIDEVSIEEPESQSAGDVDLNARRITPRRGLDFGLDEEIPRHWFGGDAFKSRFFDALSLTFPEGERYFIHSVRNYRDQIDDPKLKAEVRDFIDQEAQHGKAHEQYNARIAAQGFPMAEFERYQDKILGFYKNRLPHWFQLSMTAAAEHMTAIMAHGFYKNPGMFDDADRRIRALYFWHAVEEIEHKAVAFDVLRDVAKAGYFKRVIGLIYMTIDFSLVALGLTNALLKTDRVPNRGRVMLRGMWWLYGPRGIYWPTLRHYLTYFKPGFHPWNHGDMAPYERWRQHYADTGGNPVEAGDRVLAEQQVEQFA